MATLRDLRRQAEEVGIVGYSRMRKSELEELIGRRGRPNVGEVVTVTCGARVKKFRAVGRSLTEVVARVKSIMGIRDGMAILVDGEQVDGDYVLKDGQRVSAIPRAGRNAGR